MRNTILFAALLTVLGFQPVAVAASRHAHPTANSSAETLAEGRLSLEQAVAKVERRYGARAVRAEEHREGDRTVYRIRLLTADGRVMDVTVDPVSGEVR